jgi:hypothetical protein
MKEPGSIAIAITIGLLCLGGGAAGQDPGAPGGPAPAAPPRLEETRLIMGKWIETQQIISKERNDWQHGREVLLGRLELVKKEIAGLEEKLRAAKAAVAEAQAKRDEANAQNDQLKAVGTQLAGSVTAMEGEVRKLHQTLPEPVRAKLEPLHQRIPADPAATKVSVAERYQNVLGILNELNKAHQELTVTYEVRNLADGRPSEVRVLYVGLAQAYYVSASGEAGIGRPTADGWKWEPSQAVAADVLRALEIVQGKHSPAFVPLPVKLQ